MVTRNGDGLVFLLASPRAGATLLGAILGSHSQLYCPPEPWFLLALFGLYDKRPMVAAPYDHDLARRAMFELMDESVFTASARAFSVTLYNHFLEVHDKPIFIDKNGRYYHVASKLRQAFPGAFHIWLKRNPLDVVSSYKTTWNVPADNLFADIKHPNSFDVTIGFTELVRHFSQDDDKSFVLKYEDLVARPFDIVSELCSWLGVEFERSMLSPFKNEPLITAYSSSTFGDKKIHHEGSIHAKSLASWKTCLTTEELRITLRALGTQLFAVLGYEDALDEALVHAGMSRAELSDNGRLEEFERAWRGYPGTTFEAVVDSSTLWQALSGQAALAGLQDAVQKALRELESLVKENAHEAEARLALLQSSEATRAQLERVLEEREITLQSRVREAEEKEAALQLQAHAADALRREADALRQEAEARLELLQSAEAARADLQRTIEEIEAARAELQRAVAEKEAALQSWAHEVDALRHEADSLRREAEARLALLQSSEAARGELQRVVAEKEAALQSLLENRSGLLPSLFNHLRRKQP
jgi:hypothetical protein